MIMVPYMRKLVIAALAILAFAASNFVMVSSGMAHGTASSGHHMAASACEAAHDFAAGDVDDHSCAPAPKGMCGDGPTCCSNACQALILTSDVASFRQMGELVEPLPIPGSSTSAATFLERPPRA